MTILLINTVNLGGNQIVRIFNFFAYHEKHPYILI